MHFFAYTNRTILILQLAGMLSCCDFKVSFSLHSVTTSVTLRDLNEKLKLWNSMVYFAMFKVDCKHKMHPWNPCCCKHWTEIQFSIHHTQWIYVKAYKNWLSLPLSHRIECFSSSMISKDMWKIMASDKIHWSVWSNSLSL